LVVLIFLAIITRNNYNLRKYKKYMDIFYVYIISYFVLLCKKKTKNIRATIRSYRYLDIHVLILIMVSNCALRLQYL